MTAFKLTSPEIPASDAFWYRMALIDVQQALTNVPAGFDQETVDAIFDAVSARYEEMWQQRKIAKTPV